MSIITVADALKHLRLPASYPTDQVQPYLDAAESAAQAFLNRRIFVDQTALQAAQAALPAALAGAATERDAGMAAAGAIGDCEAAEVMRRAALDRWADALQTAEEVARGIVINERIKIGILLLTAHLFQNRSDVVTGVTADEVPKGAQHFLLPDRIGWGG